MSVGALESLTQDQIQELIQKAAFVTADLAPGGKLNPEQADRFIRGVIEASTIAREARVERMASDRKLIEKIGFASRILQPATEATAPADTTKPATGKVELVAREVIAAIDISFSSLEDNIERQRLADTIMEQAMERAGVDLEELYVNGDTASSDPYLALLDGWLKVAGNVYDHANGSFNASTVFGSMLRLLPKKYLRNKREWRFYVHPDIEDLYRDQLAERATGAGDRFALEDAPVLYKGIPVVSVHTMGTSQVDPDSTPNSGDEFDVSSVLLAHPRNLIVGIHRDVGMERERRPRARVLELTLTARVAAAVEEAEALVVARNVRIN